MEKKSKEEIKKQNQKELITTTAILMSGAFDPDKETDVGKATGIAAGMSLGSGAEFKAEDYRDLYIKTAAADAIKKQRNATNEQQVSWKDRLFSVIEVIAYIIAIFISLIVCAFFVNYWWVALLALPVVFGIVCVHFWRSANSEKQAKKELKRTEKLLRTQKSRGKIYTSEGISRLIKPAAVLAAAALIVTFIIISVNSSNRRKALLELAETNFSQDFEEHLEALNGYGLNIDGTYKLDVRSYEKGTLYLNCDVTYKSDNIYRFLYVQFNSEGAEKACRIIKAINNAKESNDYYEYSNDSGKVVIRINGSSGSFYKIRIYSDNYHIFGYYNSAGWDSLDIDGEMRYLEEEDL